MAGNWKMYKNAAETAAFFEAFRPLVEKTEGRDVVICPPFVNIPAAVSAAAGSKVEIGGQDLYWAKEGAFTGEVSGPMLVAAGCQWVIIGHSERRQYFGETDETVYQKTVAALEAVDAWIPQLTGRLAPGDLVLFTADHGCDPTTPSTDHTREYVPLLAYGPEVLKSVNLGVRASLSDIGQTIAENFGAHIEKGVSFLNAIL